MGRVSCPVGSSELVGSGVELSLLEVVVVDPVADGVHLPSDGEEVSVVGLRFEVLEGPDEEEAGDDHVGSELLVGSSVAGSSLHEGDEVGDVEGHLRSGCGRSVLVVEHAVLELAGHTDDHVVEVGVEALSSGHLDAEGRLVVVAGRNVVDVVGASGSHADLGEVGGPDSAVRVLGLVLREVGGVDAVVDDSVALVPLLVVVLLEVVVSGVNGEAGADESGELNLLVGLVEEQVVFLEHHAVAVSAVAGEDQKAATDRS